MRIQHLPPSELMAAPEANSDMLALPMMTAPAARSFFTQKRIVWRN